MAVVAKNHSRNLQPKTAKSRKEEEEEEEEGRGGVALLPPIIEMKETLRSRC